MPSRRIPTDVSPGPHGGRPRGRHIKVWVTPEEEARIAERAAQAGLKHSAYLRSLGLNTPLRSVIDLKAVQTLAQANGELGRTAELLKGWLAAGSGYENEIVGRVKGLTAEVGPLLDALRRLQIRFHEIAACVLRP